MQREKRIDGSPRNEACANIDSCGTANSSSASEMISAATAEHKAGLVPLYLIGPAIIVEVNRFGDAIEDIHVHRTTKHQFSITILIREEGDHA